MSRIPWIASSPPPPRMAAPRIRFVSASATTFIKPLVSPFSIARPTRVIGAFGHQQLTAGARRLRPPHTGAPERWIDIERIRGDPIPHPTVFTIEKIGSDDLVL